MDFDELYHRLGVLEFNLNLYSATLDSLQREKRDLLEIINKSIKDGDDSTVHPDSKLMGDKEGGKEPS